MRKTKCRYRLKRSLATLLCAGMLFSGLGDEVQIHAAISEMQQVEDENDVFYRYGSGGGITEGELDFQIEKPVQTKNKVARLMSIQSYTTSQVGVDEIKRCEGIVLDSEGMVRVYDDMQPSVILQADTKIKGTLTIGYGHTGKINGEALTWETKMTVEEAEELLRNDIAKFEIPVNSFCSTYGIELTQYQFDALVCFTYNLGSNWTTYDSSMALMLRNGYTNYSDDHIVNIFSLYKYSNKVLLPGLVQRRRREAAMFLNNAALANYKVGTYEVDYDMLAVRSGPGTTYEKVASLNKGTQVGVNMVNGSWGYSEAGWMSLDYCKFIISSDEPSVMPNPVTPNPEPVQPEPVQPDPEPVTPEPQVQEPTKPQEPEEADYPTGFYEVIISELNVRSGPGTSYSAVKIARKGEVYRITKTCGRWGKTSAGWMSLRGDLCQIYKPGNTSITTKGNITTGIKLGWSEVSEADGYYVYRKKGSGSYEKIKNITSGSTTSYVDKDVVNGTMYQYKIYSYRMIDGAACKSSASSAKKIVRLKGTSGFKLKSPGAKKLAVSWSKDSKVTGYQIQYSMNSKFASAETKTVTIKSNGTVSKTISGLNQWKTYYVRIRTYHTVDGTKYYSQWSSKLSRIVA